MSRVLFRKGIGATVVLACAAALIWFGIQWFVVTSMSEARRAFAERNFPLAVQLAEQHLSEHPNDQEAMLMLARSYSQLGMWAEAEAYFGQVTLRKLDDFHLRARGLASRSLWSEASSVYEQIRQKWPNDGR